MSRLVFAVFAALAAPADAAGDAAADLFAHAQAKKASVADSSPALLPYFNNGPVFGLPGTDAGDFWHRTQLTGDWGGARTPLAQHGMFVDLYSTGAWQDVASGGLKTGDSFVQNTQLSINLDTGRAGLWPGGLFHFTVESRYGSSPQNTFTVGSTVPQYTALAMPGPFLGSNVEATEYFLLQALTPRFSVLLGKLNVLNLADHTLFGHSYKYWFANLNFNKNPMALNFSNTYTLAAVAAWVPTDWLTVAGGVLDPNTQADNFAAHAFESVNLYGLAILSYRVGGLPGQFMPQFNWSNKPKLNLASPFESLSPAQAPQALGVLLGSPSTASLPIRYKPNSWAAIANFAQYLFVVDEPQEVVEKLASGQPLRGFGLFGRFGYAPSGTNTITLDGSIALFAHGLLPARTHDSVGAGFYYNAISGELKNEIRMLTDGAVTVHDEMGAEVFYDFALTPAIRLIPGYQHVWSPLAAHVVNRQNGADVLLARLTLAF